MVLAVLYFIGIFLIRNRISSTNSRTKDKKVELSPMISEFLFYEDSNSKEEKMNYLNLKIQIRELIKDNFDRSILTEVLQDLRKDLSGQSQTVLIELYKDLGLHNDAYEKLSKRRWQIISSGILELTTMEVRESYGLIIKFINHRQGTVRKQAEIAVVNLKEEGIGYFLDNTKYKISEWQQLKLLDVLRHKPNFKPPSFGLWLTSTNSHVVLFSLRLIKYYKQSDAEQSIITLLKHKKRDIQAEAIDCIKEFFFVSALSTLKMVYGKASTDIKIAILDAIGEIGSKSDVEFLEQLKKKERNFNIKSKVLGTLNKLDPESILPTKNISGSDYFSSTAEDNEDIDEAQESIENENTVETPEIISQNINEIEEELVVEEEENEPIIEEQIEYINTNENLEHTVQELNEVERKSDSDISEEITSVEESSIVDIVSEIDLSFLPRIDTDVVEEEEAISTNLETVGEEERALTFDFLPLIITNPSIEKGITNDEDDGFVPMFSLDEDLDIEHNEIENQVDSFQENVIEEIDWANVTKYDTNQYVEITKEPLISFENDTITFSANFMFQGELDTMVLLENIAEMGDCRELPMLHELLAENTSPLILDRTNELIQRFSYQSPRPNELFSSSNDLTESVFAEVYNHSDKETKLILLQEIKRIGDKKEIQLLENIINTESKTLVKSAKSVLKHIKSQIALTNAAVINTVENKNPLFEVDFELGLREASKRMMRSNENGSTIFDQLCSMSNTLYNKING
jgi:HEAT repeat protein